MIARTEPEISQIVSAAPNARRPTLACARMRSAAKFTASQVGFGNRRWIPGEICFDQTRCSPSAPRTPSTSTVNGMSATSTWNAIALAQVSRLCFAKQPAQRSTKARTAHLARRRVLGVPSRVPFRAVFDALSDRLQGALGDLRKRGTLDEESISRAMREIRLALLEADVNLEVVRDFVARVRERAVGQEVLKSLTPGQHVVKIVHEELTALMGAGASGLAFSGRPPTVILLAGLQGSGKTTAAAKLALFLRKAGRSPGLVAADLQRPAAIEQLEQLGRQISVPVYREDDSEPVTVVRNGIGDLAGAGVDAVILDTAGRLHVDEDLMSELERVRDEAKPTNVLLVLDAMTGQEAVSVALAFQQRIAFDGVLLTKLDGDARGGAALSVKAVTGRPIKYVSVGE
jgi:signal recognition particle GTPase